MLGVWVGRGCNWADVERRISEGGTERKAEWGAGIFQRLWSLLPPHTVPT